MAVGDTDGHSKQHRNRDLKQWQVTSVWGVAAISTASRTLQGLHVGRELLGPLQRPWGSRGTSSGPTAPSHYAGQTRGRKPQACEMWSRLAIYHADS